MPLIELHTIIDSDIKTCFDLSRDVGFYQNTLPSSEEIAIDGKVTGLVELNDQITWETNHLGFAQHVTLKVTEFDSPNLFVDELVKGGFKAYNHKHIFEKIGNKTVMTDKFYFETPYGIFGKFVNWLFLKKYMTKLLKTRNHFLKKAAENN